MNDTVTILDNGQGSMDDSQNVTEMTVLEIWGYGFLFVTIINLSSVMGILFFPLMKKSFYTVVMRTMIGLAIGSLSGSAIFHLIPQAFGLSHSTAQSYTFTASFIWLSIWIVMILECLIKILVKAKARKREKRRLGEAMESRPLKQSNNNSKQNGVLKPEGLDENHSNEQTCDTWSISRAHELESSPSPGAVNITTNEQLNFLEMDVHRSTLSVNKVLELHESNKMNDNDKSIKTVAWIVIIGDSLHNFIDGVSIGAGFTQSFSAGLILSLAVICEEFPHELGDFAILINSGLSVKRAILFNFLSAITCYLGLILGILLGKIEFEHFIFAFAAGIFLYVSLADMVPEVTEAIDKASDTSGQKALLVLLNYHIGIILGILILYVLAISSF